MIESEVGQIQILQRFNCNVICYVSNALLYPHTQEEDGGKWVRDIKMGVQTPLEWAGEWMNGRITMICYIQANQIC
jgi:hypothetical protein